MYKAIKRVSSMQDSFISVGTRLLKYKKDIEVCGNINVGLFNQSMNHQDLFFYMENAIEAFVFLQKGFYCMACDAEAHSYLNV